LRRLCAAPRDGGIDEKDMTAADVSSDYLGAQPHGGNPVMSPGTRPLRGVAWWVAFLVCKPALTLVRRRDWRGLDQIPSSGGVVLAANHVSHVAPLLIAEMVLAQGRTPAFLAKSSLFGQAIVGRWFRAAGHAILARHSHPRGDR